MDIEKLKKQYRHKRKLDYADIDTALRAVPFLLREFEKLEEELKYQKGRIAHLNAALNKQPSLEKKGEKGKGQWVIRIDEEKNRLYLKLSGYFDYQAAKVASYQITSVISNLRANADAINDLSDLKGFEKRAVFHIRKIIHTLDYVGVNRVVRITDPGSKISTILDRLYQDEKSYTVSQAGSLQEADSILDQGGQFLKA